MEDDDLTPPRHLLIDGSLNEEQFRSVGESFTRHCLIGRAGLQPTENVLDIGSGNGRNARALVNYLHPPGTYEGFDIVAEAVTWCTDRYRRFDYFRFQVADIYSKHYNPDGRIAPHDYRLPYRSESFDVVFLSSVFTHMLPPGMRNYLTEIARVLRPNGRSVITFFLLNGESRRLLADGKGTIRLPYIHETDACRVADPETPEFTVGHDEGSVRALYDRLGLSIVEISYGNWCGRRELLGMLQDVIIAVR